MKLHLGCGERYFDGYVNIDFPAGNHTVQKRSVADRHADLLNLQFPAGTIEEVRLHHVFEHFPRQIACSLVAAWNAWIKSGGILRIEVPDLALTGLAAINPFSSVRRRGIAERHLFGSHEAGWASHKEGYSTTSLRLLIETFGFSAQKIKRNSWRGTYNFEIVAVKKKRLTQMSCGSAASTYLRQHLVDDGEGELRLLDAWMLEFTQQLERCWPRDA